MSTTARLSDSNAVNLSSLILPCSSESLKPSRPAWLAKHKPSTVTGSDADAINRTVGRHPPHTFLDFEKEALESAVATAKAQRAPRRKPAKKPVRKTSTKKKAKPKKKTTKRKK